MYCICCMLKRCWGVVKTFVTVDGKVEGYGGLI